MIQMHLVEQLGLEVQSPEVRGLVSAPSPRELELAEALTSRTSSLLRAASGFAIEYLAYMSETRESALSSIF